MAVDPGNDTNLKAPILLRNSAQHPTPRRLNRTVTIDNTRIITMTPRRRVQRRGQEEAQTIYNLG